MSTNQTQDQPTMRPYGRHLFICNQGTCCEPEVAEALHRRINELNRAHSLNKLRNPKRVKCTLAECLGVCRNGPIVAVYPDGIWYANVDEAKLERIYHEHVLGGDPVHELAFHWHYPRFEEPAYAPDLRADEPLADDEVSQFDVDASKRESGLLTEESVTKSSVETYPNREEQAAEVRRAVRRARKKKGLVIVNTGNGKGKTTAALGVMTRAWGRKMKIGVLQFLKNENARFGEIKAAERMGEIDWLSTGDGWTWTSQDEDETMSRARHGWQIAKERIAEGSYDLLVLDEFTYPLHFGWLNTEEVVAWLRDHKPPMLHLIITGRNAPPPLIEYADLVTEMREVKHPFTEQGIRAQAGIEY